MYAFRKPFTAATFSGGVIWGVPEKTALVTAQVLGYALSKLIGIRVVAEISATRRAATIVGLIGLAELALILFALVPSPFHLLCIFMNGLPLGLVFGMILGFLEGRKLTEAMMAGLCASFILADGVTKSVGSWLLTLGVTERRMPAVAGSLFVVPLLACVAMLARIPPPSPSDIACRSAREPMNQRERRTLISKYAIGLIGLVGVYLLVTIARSVRGDFAPELWGALGTRVVPVTFAQSELIVTLGVLVVNGMASLVIDNRRAFFGSLAVVGFGPILMGFALAGQSRGSLDAFPFMVLMGLGLYLPYVAIHTTVFERMIAMTRERGNLGFLMYLADGVGYLGYAVIMTGRTIWPMGQDFLPFYQRLSWSIAILALGSVTLAWIYFRRWSHAHDTL
jgi:hypothetical protein